MPPFEIDGRGIGGGAPCYVIAEAGVNHNGDLALARRLIDAAAAAGADAVKFQTFKTERLVTASAPQAEYQQRNTGSGETQQEMLRRLELDETTHGELRAHCRARNIPFLSTPFEEESADLLERLGVPAYKLPSGELTNSPLLAHVARKGRPMLVSTGMATQKEVAAAVDAIRAAGAPPMVLLHCVSNYPAAPADTNLRAMATMALAFNVPVGFSDHSEGDEIALAAVALGACVLEKHLTLDRTLPGPDHRASLEPGEFASLVRKIRRIEAALGHGRKEPAASELGTAAVARKSLTLTRDVDGGSVLTADCLTLRRPGTGLSPDALERVIGRKARHRLPAGTQPTLDDLE
jgi:N,N'-diacetyllegionaminate synthase